MGPSRRPQGIQDVVSAQGRDYIAAEKSTGFHAPQEASLILAEAIDYARQGQIAALEARSQTAGATAPVAADPGPATSQPPAPSN